jgi:hypothetical protein
VGVMQPKKAAKIRAKSRSALKTRARVPLLPVAPHVSEFSVGDGVTHPQFGTGVIEEISDDKLTIRFSDDHQRQVLDYYVTRAEKRSVAAGQGLQSE